MKRIAIVFVCILFASTVFASGGRPKRLENANIFGSDDRQHGHNRQVVTVDPERPVNPVPEPHTLLLLGAGLIGPAAYGRKWK